MFAPSFKYPRMVPSLKKYLKWLDKRPPYEFEPGSHKATEASKAAVAAWEAKLIDLAALVPEGEPRAYYRAKLVWMCRDKTQNGAPAVTVSPSGKYTLSVTHHQTGKSTWDTTKGVVSHTNGADIETVCRNYSHFPFAWVEGHGKTGEDYLICGESYQGQTVVNLTTGERLDYIPQEADEGMGFCWVGIYPNSKGTLLAVDGCVWGGPYEVLIVDFSSPMELPWRILRHECNGNELSFEKWDDENTCRLVHTDDVVNLPGHPLDGKVDGSLTDSEDEEVQAEVYRRVKEQGSYTGWREGKFPHVVVVPREDV